MAEKKETQGGKGTGGDASKAKKKIVIKKATTPQNKDISELFERTAKPSGAQKAPGGGSGTSQPARPAAGAGGGSAGSSAAASGSAERPAAREQSPRPSQPSSTPERRPQQGGAPSQGGGGGAYRPAADSRSGGQGGGQGGYRGGGQQGGGQYNRGPGGPGQRGPGGPGQYNRGPGGPGQYNRGPGGPGQGQRGPGGGPGQRGPGGPGQRSGGPGAPSRFAGAATPFDAILEGAKKPGTGEAQRSKKRVVAPTTQQPRKRGAGEDNEQYFRKRLDRKKAAPVPSVPKQIEILESIQVGELAKKLNLKPGDVIARLMKMGEMVTINKVLDADTATLLANEYGCEVKVVSLYEETVIEEEKDQEESRSTRPPVVTIMGHVDHGKTKLLDTIRKTNVVAGEAGFITQHIGAYQVKTPGGKITFLDTPGHEAFTAMRARGAAVTDIVVLVVAADDGVKEQTVEAITHAKEANVPIIVAINKVDLPTANQERVKQELARYGLQSEDWGGTTMFCPISAKENIGIDHLLEMILLQAEVLDLRANPDLRAQGRVVEARIDPGKGPVATVLVQKGTLRAGDPYVVGVYSGRVRAMFDDLGHKIEEAGPATPVEISGIDGVPAAGDPFQAVINEKYGREIAAKRQHYKQITDAAARVPPSLGDLKNWLADHKELKVIIKADVQGSVEAIRDGLLKLSTEDVKVRVVFGATGAISESDVNLASASEGIIVGFQVRPTPRAQELAEQLRVEIKFYSIIYNVIEEIRAAMEGLLEPDKIEEVSGRAEIRQVFKISKMGNVAGCMVTSGKIRRANKVRLIRDNKVIYTGMLGSLKRIKDDAAEVAEGYECGLSIDGYKDIRVGDQVESFEVKEVARKL